MALRRLDVFRTSLMHDLDTRQHAFNHADGTAPETRLIERFRDFAHCNRSEHISPAEAVAAYTLISELQQLKSLVASMGARGEHGFGRNPPAWNPQASSEQVQ
jgi:hypothetical protein